MILAFLLALAATTPQPIPVEIIAPGPEGPLAGTLLDPGPRTPLVLIVPGSGPTDRDGNSPLGVAGGPYKHLAEALAADGIASVRIDKRGMFGSKAAFSDVYASTTAGYADDVHAWSTAIGKATGRSCVWVAGHSEGALVALVAAQTPKGVCGLILISGGGRRLSDVLREQLKANPANAPILSPSLAAIDALEAGKRVPEATLPAAIRPLFADKMQGYWIDLFSRDPATLIAATMLPVLILQGERDVQVSVADAQRLKRAQPRATLMLLPGVNHVLRTVASDNRAANVATYNDATQPISPAVAAAVAAFVKRQAKSTFAEKRGRN